MKMLGMYFLKTFRTDHRQECFIRYNLLQL